MAPPAPPGHPRGLGIGSFGIFQHFFQCGASPRSRAWLCFHGSVGGSGGRSPFPSHPIPCQLPARPPSTGGARATATHARVPATGRRASPRLAPWQQREPSTGRARGDPGSSRVGRNPRGNCPQPLHSTPRGGQGPPVARTGQNEGWPGVARCPGAGCSVPGAATVSQWCQGVPEIAVVSQRWP